MTLMAAASSPKSSQLPIFLRFQTLYYQRNPGLVVEKSKALELKWRYCFVVYRLLKSLLHHRLQAAVYSVDRNPRYYIGDMSSNIVNVTYQIGTYRV